MKKFILKLVAILLGVVMGLSTSCAPAYGTQPDDDDNNDQSENGVQTIQQDDEVQDEVETKSYQSVS